MKTFLTLLTALNLCAPLARAWDYEGHRIVNQLALASLPTNFPAFTLLPAAQERIAFLAGEADRWRNSTNPAAKHGSAPEHYLDVDDIPLHGLTAKTASPFRYDFAGALRLAREKNPDKFPVIDPAKNADHTRELVGFLPWAINDYFAKLESGFSYLRTFQEFGGTPEEIANAQQNIIYIMGVMGHFAGDAAQPLHTTKHFNGWVGPNPEHYSTNNRIHSWIDGGFIRATRITAAELKPQVRTAHSFWTNAISDNDVFGESMQFILDQNALVEPLYAMDRDGKLSPRSETVREGRKFISGQLIKGGQFLGDLWFSAWQNAPMDKFLKTELGKRTKEE